MFNDYTYLYVEDDPFSRQIMQMIMENAMGITGLTILEDSRHFTETLCRLEPRPQVFLLDIHVKPLNGFQMLKHIRQEPDYRNAVVIALTASVMNEEVEKLRQSGFDSAISKPLSVLTFPDLIGRILEGESIWYISE